MKQNKKHIQHKASLKVYVTKGEDGIVKVCFGEKPVMRTTGFYGCYWEHKNGGHFDIITEQGAYWYSNVLKELFKDIAPKVKYDKPLVFTISAEEKKNNRS